MLPAIEMKGKDMSRYFPIAIGAVLFSFFLAAEAVAADPFEGTWKLNLAKSQFNTGPAPQSQIVRIEILKNLQSLVADEVDANGKAMHGGFNAKYNEMDYPCTLHPSEDTIALKRTNTYTVISLSKKNGEAVAKIQWVVSKDGNTMIGTEKVKKAKGDIVPSTYVYDRQKSAEPEQSSEQRLPGK
jgi:hypothetical protein